MAKRPERRSGPDTTPDRSNVENHGDGNDGLSVAHGADVPRQRRLGCPCGCRTRMPWLDDPDCKRHYVRISDPEKYLETAVIVGGGRVISLREWLHPEAVA